MISTTKSLRAALGLAIFGIAAAALAPAPAKAQNQHMEVIHHPNYDRNVFMPFVPAIKIKSGKILWLAGTTALPVYHDHPHKREQILQYMPNDLEAQTRATMEKASRRRSKPPAARSRTWCTCSCFGRGRGWATSARRAR